MLFEQLPNINNMLKPIRKQCSIDNAGIAGLKNFGEQTDDGIVKIMAVNCLAAVFFTIDFKDRLSGHDVISSIASLLCCNKLTSSMPSEHTIYWLLNSMIAEIFGQDNQKPICSVIVSSSPV